MNFEIHTIDSAPVNSTAALRALQQGLGFVPNLAATMAGSPAPVCGFVDLRATLAGDRPPAAYPPHPGATAGPRDRDSATWQLRHTRSTG